VAAKKSATGTRPTIKSSHRGGTPSSALERKKPVKKVVAAKRPVAKTAVKSPTLARRESAEAAPRSKRSPAAGVLKQKDGVKASPRAGLAQSESLASDAARQMAIDIAAAGLEKKALGLEILDVAGRVDYADFLVLMSGRSDRQVASLAQGIEEALRLKGKRALSTEGLPHANWVVMDFGDVVVHVFQEHARSTYDLDGLWMDARRIPVPISQA
jgi:ribosome-associated protein